MNQTTSGKNSIDIDADRAMELANLVLVAYKHYEDFDEQRRQGLGRKWQMPTAFYCSDQNSYDYHLPLKTTDKTLHRYEVLAQFWHTDRPIGSLRLWTVPFGFIVRKMQLKAPCSPENSFEPTDEVFVVFRGTLNSQEWRNNARFKKSEVIKGIVGAGFVHQGFNSIFELSYLDRLKTWPGVLSCLLKLVGAYQPPRRDRRTSIRRTLEQTIFDDCKVDRKTKIFITGHSLGGALALLAGRVIINLGSPEPSVEEKVRGTGEPPQAENLCKKNLAICTFGAPRTGDPSFADIFNGATVVRYVNTEDVVPTVPPATGHLLGIDMKLTPEGMKEYKRKGVQNFNNIFTATDGEAPGRFVGNVLRSCKSAFLSSTNQPEKYSKSTASYTHVGECRSFTLSQDSVSFNHNHQITYRQGITRYCQDLPGYIERIEITGDRV